MREGEPLCWECRAELGLPKELCQRHAPQVDWTVGLDGRANSSAKFEYLVAEVTRLIRDDARMLITGHADATAGLIVAQLAHRHGLRPR